MFKLASSMFPQMYCIYTFMPLSLSLYFKHFENRNRVLMINVCLMISPGPTSEQILRGGIFSGWMKEAEFELIQGILDSEIHDLYIMSLYFSFRVYL